MRRPPSPCRWPPPLRRGAVVRVVAPAGPCDPERLAAGVACLRAAGLTPRLDPQAAARQGYFAGDDAARLGALQAALADREAAAIWAARGGYGAARLLPSLEVGAVAAAGKWLVGFSDVSALHALWQRAGLVSLHGANVTTLPQWSAAARDELLACLRGTPPDALVGRPLAGRGVVCGPLVGGNLTVLASLCGTLALPSWEGAVLLLEDVGERPYRLDRVLTQLRQAGALRGVVGVALGQLTDCAAAPGGDIDAEAALLSALGGLALPVVAGLPLGHEPTSRAVPLGAQATLDADAGRLVLAAPP